MSTESAGELTNAEIDNNQWNQRDRWQGPEEVDDWIDKGANGFVPTENKSDWQRDCQSAKHAYDNAPSREEYVKPEFLLLSSAQIRYVENFPGCWQQTSIEKVQPPDHSPYCAERQK
jgi:hypothetical protein